MWSQQAGVVSCGGAHTSGTGFTRTQERSNKRKHTQACLRQGIAIAAERRSLYESMVQLLDCGEAKVVLESLAIHRNDCQKLQHNVHFAAEANYVAFSLGLRSSCTHGQHKRLHRQANLVKHEHGSRMAGWSDVPLHLPPPPPPPLGPSPVAITCEAFEKSLQANVKVQYIVVEVPIVPEYIPGGIFIDEALYGIFFARG